MLKLSHLAQVRRRLNLTNAGFGKSIPAGLPDLFFQKGQKRPTKLFKKSQTLK